VPRLLFVLRSCVFELSAPLLKEFSFTLLRWERSLFSLSVWSVRRSSFFLVLAGVLWGTGGLAGDMLQVAGGLSPVSVAAYRLLGGGVVSLLFLRRPEGFLWTPGVLWRVGVSGVLLAQFQAAYQVAVSWISVSLATLITIGCVPVFVAVVGAVAERRLPGGRTLLAVGGAVVGLGLLSGGATEVGGWRLVGGVAMSLFAGAGFSVLTLVAARSVSGQHVITSGGLLFGGVLLLPVGAFYGMGFSSSLFSVVLVVYLGVVPTAVAYGVYFLGLRGAGPTAAALATMLEPLTATLLATAFYGESLSLGGVLGLVLIVGALGVFYLAPRR
jgi:DME family drug/metabolite transporter